MAKKRNTPTKPPKKIKRLKRKIHLTLIMRIRMILAVLGVFAVSIMFILHFTGIFTFDDLLVSLDIKDRPATRRDLEVHVVSCGNADCILIMSKGETMVIDAGDREHSASTVSYLKNHGVKKIKYLVATHQHFDHIGGMADVIWTFRVENMIAPKVPKELIPTSKAYERLLMAVQGTGVKMKTAKDQTLKVGDCEITVMPSPITDSDDLNNYSVVVRLVHGENTFLFTADAEKEEEMALIEKGYELNAKVLKVGHHGSYSSSSTEFLEAVDPEYAVISSGYMNEFGHPHESTMRRLKKYADKIYNTAENGDVVFVSDGEGLSVYCSETSRRKYK